MTDIARDLIGSWQLQSWKLGFSDSAKERFLFDPDPQGVLLYTEDGWMSAAICSSGRQPFPEVASFRELPAQELTDEPIRVAALPWTAHLGHRCGGRQAGKDPTSSACNEWHAVSSCTAAGT